MGGSRFKRISRTSAQTAKSHKRPNDRIGTKRHSSNWRSLVRLVDIGALIPDRYARWRDVIGEALVFFLERLPRSRRDAIIAEQARFGLTTSPAQRLVALMHHCPTLHKMGQVVARDRRLSVDFRDWLTTLESREPTTPIGEVRAVLKRELGDLKSHGITLADKPLAEASVAVVAPFSWHGGEGVFKVLREGVVDRLHGELDILADLGAFLDERCDEHDLPKVDYRHTFERVRELLTHEVQLGREQENLEQARRFYRHTDGVLIPRVLPFCTPRVTAMQRVNGKKVTDIETNGGWLAETMVNALIGDPMWSPADRSLFHADPHAGNLLLAGDGRLAILDWSLAGRLTKHVREQIVQMLMGAITLDAPRVRKAISSVAIGLGDTDGLNDAIDASLRSVCRGAPPGFSWLIRLLDQTVQRGRVRFDGQLLMFRKAVLTIEGVLADVADSCSMDDILLASGLGQFFSDALRRPFAWPFSRANAVHASNADLATLLMQTPMAAMRYWWGAAREWGERIRRSA